MAQPIHNTPDALLVHATSLALAVLDHGPDLFVAVGEDGRVVVANETAAAMLGARAGLPADSVLPAAALAALDGRTQSPTPLTAFGERLLRWERPALAPAGPVRWVMGRDVTEQEAESGALAFRLRRLELVHAITLAVARGDRLSDIFELALSELTKLVPILQGGVVLIDGDHFDVIYRYQDGRSLGSSRRVPLSESPASRVLGRKEPVHVFPGDPEEDRYPQLQALWAAGIRSILYVPLWAEGVQLGLVSLGSSWAGGLSADECDAVVEAAAQLATAILRQRLMDRLAAQQAALEERVQARTRDLEITRDQLVAAARLSTLGQLAAGLAHELNQPLNVVGGYIELLQEPGFPTARRTEVLGVMSAAVDRMTRLVRHLRTYARPAPLEIREVELADVVRMAMELSRRAAPEVSVRMHEAGEPLRVQGDAPRLEQILINLLTNARLATESAGGRFVDVELGREGRWAFVRVRDEGAGVPESVRDRVFEPFFTTRPSGQGMGLGLSISQAIAEQHGGRLELEDRGPGASFRLLVPTEV